MLVLRTRKPAFRSRPSRLLLWSTLAVVTATFAIPFLGGPSTLFGFVPLSIMELTAVATIVLGYIVATEIAKSCVSSNTRRQEPHVPVRRGRARMKRIAEADIRRVFHVSLWLKGLHSLAEVLGGLALVFLSHD